VYRAVAPYDEIICDVEHTDVNNVVVRFATAPSAGQYVVNCASPGTQSTLNVTMDPWHRIGSAGEPAFGSGFQNYPTTPYSATGVGFRKAADGRVYLKGMIQATGTAVPGALLFTLPAGYRPPGRIVLDTIRTGNLLARIEVWEPSDGGVYLAGTANLAANDWISLDHLSWDTESVLQTASLAAVPIDSWHLVGAAGEPTFTSPWVNFDNGAAVPGTPTQRNARFRKYPDGRVKLSGVVSGGTSGSTVFTLPVGYRPVAQQAFSVIAASSGGNTPTTLNISSNGGVSPTNTGTGSNVTTWVYLDGIEFDTESVAAYASGFLGPPLVTVLPANPVDGQECYFLADDPNGVVWHLRYRAASSSAYKWEYIGGSSLMARVDADETVTAGGYNDPTTPGPQITLPLAGDYVYTFAATTYISGQTAATTAIVALSVGGLAPVAPDFAQSGMTALGIAISVARVGGSLSAQPSGRVLKLQYNMGAGGGTPHARYRTLELQPVRVG